MIYFIINNNYQRYDFELHLSELQSSEVVLIEIPHTLDKRDYPNIRTVLRYQRASRQGLSGQILCFLQQSRRINKEIVPTSNDICFIYTEYELLNQYIAKRFKEASAKVYLIEDGGLATYLPFRFPESEPLTIRQWIKQAVFRMLPKLSDLRFHKINGHLYPWMSDAMLDGVCFYRPLAIARNIPVVPLKRPPQIKVKSIRSRVVFLNQPMYGTYQEMEDYLSGLGEVIKNLCDGFDTVLFKFHPRESIEQRDFIKRNVFSHFSKVRIIEEDTGIEEVIDRYQPSVAASYFSAGLLSLLDRGIEPLYLYHLIPDLRQQPICREITSVLDELGYNFAHSFCDANANYHSGLLEAPEIEGAVNLAGLVRE